MVSELINANPIVYEKKERRDRSAPSVADEYTAEPIDQLEIFDILDKGISMRLKFIHFIICESFMFNPSDFVWSSTCDP
ncbi:hypothetical protein A4A49_13790 [Nicotiana attenuata]|uniref:Uncharacterized protein n=1 Tax=Nicotiana attenuata TaxID=49451 RepID=A0A1J6IJP7_NICAT|nr:hypothetical protein A4A49_13790 [Nicotiana attenuata]